MINLDKKKPDNTNVDFTKIILNSTILALILTTPALTIFLGLYFTSGNLLLSAVTGFGVHFGTLAFSGKISNWLVRLQT